MNGPTRKYRYRLWKHLTCFPSSRKKLMTLFRTRLADYLEETPSPSYDGLVEAFGTPEEMAATLLTAVSSKEQIAYARFSKGVEIAGNVAVAVLVLLTVYVLLTPLNIRIVDAVRRDVFYSNHTFLPH